jgi:serine/threonine protein phosphatase PrpC
VTTSSVRVRGWSATSVGRVREGNEDSLFQGKKTFAVADGMGGHQAGEIASATALEPVARLDDQDFATADEAMAALREAVIAANTSVFEKAADDPGLRGMGTTLTVLLVREGQFHLAHVGDTRAYLLRGDELSQLTEDHTLVQQLVKEHRLKPHEVDTHPQRSVITRAIGVDRWVDVDTLASLEMLPGDQILLCSDGLTGPVKKEQIASILMARADGEQTCQALIDAANDAGGPDNITVVLVRVEDDPPAGGAGAGAVRSRSGDTQDLGPPIASASFGGSSAGPVTQIRTLIKETEEFDARKFGHYGGRQGAEGRGPSAARARGWRVIGTAVGVLFLFGIMAVGAFMVLSRAYFVGDQGGIVAIFRGLPQQVGNLVLYRPVEPTAVRTADLPKNLQDQLRKGIPMATIPKARQYVRDTLMPQAEEAERARRATPEPPLLQPDPRPPVPRQPMPPRPGLPRPRPATPVAI